MRIVTAGSCFAQHVGRTLKGAGFNVMDVEPFPVHSADEVARKFGYGIYSARYGNIYTVRHLLQLLQEARGTFEPAMPVWERDGRFFDAMRPNVEPFGLESAELVLEHRQAHLKAVARAFRRCEMLVFTFGLTEAWLHRESGTVYPTAPGVIAGEYDPDIFEFKNFSYDEILSDFRKVLQILGRKKERFQVLVTTSPVPLTATASGAHVEVATCHSKSILRAVCGALHAQHDNVDYFPSYEIITSAHSRGAYFKANQRDVSEVGVRTAMELYLRAHGAEAVKDQNRAARPGKTGNDRKVTTAGTDSDVVCEDLLLEQFSRS